MDEYRSRDEVQVIGIGIVLRISFQRPHQQRIDVEAGDRRDAGDAADVDGELVRDERAVGIAHQRRRGSRVIARIFRLPVAHT